MQRLRELGTDWALAVLKKPEVLQLYLLPNWKSDTLSFCQAARTETSDKSFQLPQKWRERTEWARWEGLEPILGWGWNLHLVLPRKGPSYSRIPWWRKPPHNPPCLGIKRHSPASILSYFCQTLEDFTTPSISKPVLILSHPSHFQPGHKCSLFPTFPKKMELNCFGGKFRTYIKNDVLTAKFPGSRTCYWEIL